MTDCRISVLAAVGSGSRPGPGKWQFSGSGFLVPGGVVTAAHVVRDRRSDQIRLEDGHATAAPVAEIVADAELDVAFLRIEGLPATRVAAGLGEAGAAWTVTTRPKSNDPQLSGHVTAGSRAILNQAGHAVDLLQLSVTQLLKDFSGYSGSAVRLASSSTVVIGVLCEQVRTRMVTPGVSRAPASNVLYAVSLRDAMARLGFRLPTRFPAIEQLIDRDELAAAETEIARRLRADDDDATLWQLRSRVAMARQNPDVARQYLRLALARDPRHVGSIAALIRVLLVSNGATERDEAQRLADRSHAVDGSLDAWLSCLAAHGTFGSGIRSATDLDEHCPWDGEP